MIKPTDIPGIVQNHMTSMQAYKQIMDIFDGNLLPYLLKEMQAQMSPATFEQAKFRLSPINILPKIIDKLTNIYQTTVMRNVVEGTEADNEVLEWYVENMDANTEFNSANELFNLANATLIQPYVYNGKPYIREIPPDKYILLSRNPVQPYIPTDIILSYCYNGKEVFWVYSDDAIYAVDLQGKVLTDLMAQNNILDMVNPIGRLPFTYINSAKYKIKPCPDADMLQIIKLLPVQLSDLNYAAMFQCFSIIYGVNVDEEDLKMAPNAFWRFKSDATSDKTPEIGVLKPQVDYSQVLQLVQSQLSMWLGTKGIRASSVGQLAAQDNFASGISKVIDEMDTYEAREKQVGYFTKAESQFWDLVLHSLHPYWLATGQIQNVGQFSPTAQVKTTFAVQLPLQTRGQVVSDMKLEFESGFTSRKRAIQQLNPQMTDDEVEQLMQEIEDESATDEKYLNAGVNNGVAASQFGNPG